METDVWGWGCKMKSIVAWFMKIKSTKIFETFLKAFKAPKHELKIATNIDQNSTFNRYQFPFHNFLLQYYSIENIADVRKMETVRP